MTPRAARPCTGAGQVRCIGAAFAALFLLGCAAPQAEGDDATGTLEYVETRIAPLAPGRVAAVLRREGERVATGDTLAVITQPLTSSDLGARQARMDGALAVLRDLEAGARPAELDGAQSALRGAEADASGATREATRLRALAAAGAVPEQQADNAESRAKVAVARRDAAADALRLVRAGARPDRLNAARAEVAAARAAVDAAQRSAADLVLSAPMNGVVTSRSAEPGETVGPGTVVMSIADVTRPFVRVFVSPALAPRVRIGGAAVARLDAFPRRGFAGRIAAVSPRAEFTPRVALTRDERADLLFAVRVELSDTTGMLKAGLPVTVRFPPGE